MWFKAILLILLAAIAYLLFDISRSVGDMTPENQVNIAAQMMGIPSPETTYPQKDFKSLMTEWGNKVRSGEVK